VDTLSSVKGYGRFLWQIHLLFELPSLVEFSFEFATVSSNVLVCLALTSNPKVMDTEAGVTLVISRMTSECCPDHMKDFQQVPACNRTIRFMSPPSFKVINSHTPWCRVFLVKLIGAQTVKEVPCLYGTRRFVTSSQKPKHWTLSSGSRIHSPPSHPISVRFILIPSQGLSRGLFTCGFRSIFCISFLSKGLRGFQ
jgi:hypothetical protein